MGLLDDLLSKRIEQKKDMGVLVALSGLRLAGKSTLAGTLPGKTLLIQPSGIEAGNAAPVALSKVLGNQVDMVEIATVDQLFKLLVDPGILIYDHVFIDGVSALTELTYTSKEFADISAKNKWAGFDLISTQITKLIVLAKDLTVKGKNVFITYALRPKYDEAGTLISVEMIAKGTFTKHEIEGKSPNVVVAVALADDKGEIVRRLVTRNAGPYVARLGDFLDSDNPKVLPADLGELLKVMRQKGKT